LRVAGQASTRFAPLPHALVGTTSDRVIASDHLSTTILPCKGSTCWAPCLRAPLRRAHVDSIKLVAPSFSPDESILYVAISRLDERCFQAEARGEVCTHRRIRAFDVAPDGTLSHNRVFCEMASAVPGVPDGLKVDTAGRVWCVGSGGIWVVAPSGEVLGIVQTPEVVRDLAFGGPDFRTLYLTPGGSLATLEVKTPGIGARSA